MNGFRFIIALLAVFALTPSTWAFGLCDGPNIDVQRLNRRLRGQIHDYTSNTGKDRRIYSKSLNQLRDVYVYVPPGYDPDKRYPLVYWLHGFAQDEKSFLEIVEVFDQAMNSGKFPKCVMVAPDGSPKGRASYMDAGTFYLNSPLGRFEDYTVVDIWNHVVNNYSIRAEREAHVLAGASMGGFGAYNLAIKYRADFGVCIGVMPALNTRYENCRGRSDQNFDPNCFRFATEYKPNLPLASFAGGLVKVRERRVFAPVFGEGPDIVQKIAADNPAEMITNYDVKPGELEMFAGYGSEDEFNFDAGVESFVYLAKQRGLTVTTFEVPGGRHNRETGMKMLEPFADWIRPRLEKYAPN